MRKISSVLAASVVVIAIGLFLSTSINAQLLINEIEADPGNQQNDSCQYIELRGTPEAIVPNNTYFVAIDSDNAFPGRLHHVVPLGGTVVGANGLIYLVNTLPVVCQDRTPAPETTVVEYFSTLRIGGGNLEVGSESFAIIQTDANIFAGLDIDADDDGELDIAVTNIMDAVAFRIDPDQQFVYPSNSPVLGTPFQDVPDALVRFPGNNTPFSAEAYYYGEVATSPDEAVAFVAPLSSNFPLGGILTPGAPNVPEAAVVRKPRADFDGDGKTDVSVFRPGTGDWWLLQSETGMTGIRWGLESDVFVPADYDGDGKADVAVYRPSTGTWYILRSSDFGNTIVQYGEGSDIPVAGDYDGDAMADIAVYRPSEGTWNILKSSGGEDSVNYGLPTDTPVPADYDGDGIYDLAVFRDNGQWWILGSNEGNNVITFGLETDTPVPGDYDGDGKADVAVYRASAGVWYIFRSSDLGVTFSTFGLETDVPVPGDYDGDGKEDIAIFRDGQWWISGSKSGLSVNLFGVNSDIPIVAKARP